MFFQTPYDTIKFTTSDIQPEMISISYMPPHYKFTKYLYENFSVIENRGVLIEELKSFKTIMLKKSGKWEIIQPDRNTENVSFEKLYKLQQDKKDKAKENSEKILIDVAWENKKKHNTKIGSIDVIKKTLGIKL